MSHHQDPWRKVQDDKSASWSNVPQKQQLAILTLCRLLDYMQVVSFQTVCYYQLKSLDSSLSEQTLSSQAGVALGSFSGAQVLTSMVWGRLADAHWCGRKNVLLIGLLGTVFSCLGLAFSKSFISVVAFRAMTGAFHVTIGTVRTMMAENIQGKKHQARAFLLLPAAVMFASILGSTCASRLADPFVNHPGLIELALAHGGARYISWMETYPYAPPALMGAASILFVALLTFLTIEETLDSRRHLPDLGLRLSAYCKRKAKKSGDRDSAAYAVLENNFSGRDVISYPDEQRLVTTSTVDEVRGLGSIWTFKILVMLFAQAMFDFHMGAFDSLLPLFLSTPRSSAAQHLPVVFTGGLGMEPQKVAVALTIVGCSGLALQFIFYPRINSRLGNVRTFRIFCLAFPLAYCLAPYLAVIPASNGSTVWAFIALVLTIHTAGRIFVLPVTIALLNNCAADASVLGTIHGLGQTTTAIFRTAGPISAGYLFGAGLTHGVVGVVWWFIAGVAIFGWLASLFIWESHASSRTPTASTRTAVFDNAAIKIS